MVPRLKISSISPKEKIFLVPTLSLSPLCSRTSKRLSKGEEVGTMQLRVQGEQIKTRKKEKKERKKERKKEEKSESIKKNMRKEKIYEYV
jgi:hypothetical protein